MCCPGNSHTEPTGHVFISVKEVPILARTLILWARNKDWVVVEIIIITVIFYWELSLLLTMLIDFFMINLSLLILTVIGIFFALYKWGNSRSKWLNNIVKIITYKWEKWASHPRMPGHRSQTLVCMVFNPLWRVEPRWHLSLGTCRELSSQRGCGCVLRLYLFPSFCDAFPRVVEEFCPPPLFYQL
jgi:hypothetical protein